MSRAFAGLLRAANRARSDPFQVSQIWSVVVWRSGRMNVLPVEVLKDGSIFDSSDKLLPCSDETILLNRTALVASPVQPWGGGHALALARDPNASGNLLSMHSPNSLAPPLVGDDNPGWVKPLCDNF